MKQKLGILLIFINILTVFLGVSAQSLNRDSIINELNNLPDDTAKVRKINEFLWQVKFSGPSKEVIIIGERNVEIAKNLNALDQAGTALKNLGTIFYYSSDYTKATLYYKKSLQTYTEAKYTKGIADANRNLGNVYSQIGDWKQSLDYLFKSLAAYEEINYTVGISGTLEAIGIVYKTSQTVDNNIDKALEYFHKAIKVKKKNNDEKGLMSSYIYIGDVYYTKLRKNMNNQNEIFSDSVEVAKKNKDSVFYYFSNAKRINQKYKNLRIACIISDALGGVYMLEKKYDSSYVNFVSSLKAKEKMGNLYGIASTKTYLAEFFKHTNQPDSVLKYYKEALDIAKKINAATIEKDISAELANIYTENKNFEKSTSLLLRYIELNDSLNNEASTRKVTQLEMQYEFDKKEKLQEAKATRQLIILYFFIIGFILMVIMAMLIFRSYRIKQKANNLLKEKNNEISQKNIILNQQNEEIEAQRDEIETQRDFVIKQRDQIAEQNKNITDSIIYAQRIQKAVLPPVTYIGDILPDHFILLKPRDIVSGDFYWAAKRESKIIITAADCTGHGVPGAFMSLLGVSFLNNIVNTLKIDEVHPHIILNKLRDKIKTSLRQTGEAKESKDGMDMALCVIDNDEKIVEFAGANNSMLVVRNNEIEKIKADKMPVGIHHKDKTSFKNNIIKIQKGDVYYIYSDGYIDQFGGEKGRKFMVKRFKQIILKNHKESMKNQKELFNKEIENWMNFDQDKRYEQIDDILLVGFKF